MAATGSPFKTIYLHDVDNTLFFHSGATSLYHEPLINFFQKLQRALPGQHYLFTARELSVTLHNSATHKIFGGTPDTNLCLLHKLLESLKAKGFTFDPEAPILHILDALRDRDLGTSYRTEHLPLEKAIEETEIIKNILSQLEGELEAETALAALQSKMITDSITPHEKLTAYAEYIKQQASNIAKFKAEGKTYAEKLYLLAKVFEKHGTNNVLFIWTDDDKKLYEAALKEQTIKVNGEALGTIVARCVAFMHQDKHYPELPSETSYYPKLKTAITGLKDAEKFTRAITALDKIYDPDASTTSVCSFFNEIYTQIFGTSEAETIATYSLDGATTAAARYWGEA